MKTSNINYFFSVSSESGFNVVETINKILLLENLLKIGKLQEREKTFVEDDFHFLCSYYNVFIPKGTLFEVNKGPEKERIYADFKLKLLQEKETESDSIEEFLVNCFNRNRRGNFYCFTEFTVVKTLIEWIKCKRDKGIAYCPFNSIINAESELSKDNVTVDAPRADDGIDLYTRMLINMLIGNVNNVKNYYTSFEEQLNKPESHRDFSEYDFGFSCLPFALRVGFPKRNVDEIYIEDMLDRVKGRFAVIVPTRFAFLNNRQTIELKEKIFSTGRLKTVISLPAGFLVGTHVISLALVFDSKDSNHNDVSFLDLSSKDYVEAGRSGRGLVNLNQKAKTELENTLKDKKESNALKVSVSEIKCNDYNLDIGRYKATIEEAVSLEGIDTVTLEEIAEIYRAQATRSDEAGEKYYEISALDIYSNGFIGTPKKELLLNKDNKALKSLVHKGDIVLAIKGAAGKVGLVENEHGNWLAGQSFVILRLKDKAWTPEFLFWQLNSKRIKNQLGLLSTGGLIQMLKISDVKGLKLIPPTKEILQKVHDANIRRTEILQKIKELQAELASLDEII